MALPWTTIISYGGLLLSGLIGRKWGQQEFEDQPEASLISSPPTANTAATADIAYGVVATPGVSMIQKERRFAKGSGGIDPTRHDAGVIDDHGVVSAADPYKTAYVVEVKVLSHGTIGGVLSVWVDGLEVPMKGLPLGIDTILGTPASAHTYKNAWSRKTIGRVLTPSGYGTLFSDYWANLNAVRERMKALETADSRITGGSPSTADIVIYQLWSQLRSRIDAAVKSENFINWGDARQGGGESFEYPAMRLTFATASDAGESQVDFQRRFNADFNRRALHVLPGWQATDTLEGFSAVLIEWRFWHQGDDGDENKGPYLPWSGVPSDVRFVVRGDPVLRSGSGASWGANPAKAAKHYAMQVCGIPEDRLYGFDTAAVACDTTQAMPALVADSGLGRDIVSTLWPSGSLQPTLAIRDAVLAEVQHRLGPTRPYYVFNGLVSTALQRNEAFRAFGVAMGGSIVPQGNGFACRPGVSQSTTYVIPPKRASSMEWRVARGGGRSANTLTGRIAQDKAQAWQPSDVGLVDNSTQKDRDGVIIQNIGDVAGTNDVWQARRLMALFADRDNYDRLLFAASIIIDGIPEDAPPWNLKVGDVVRAAPPGSNDRLLQLITVRHTVGKIDITARDVGAYDEIDTLVDDPYVYRFDVPQLSWDARTADVEPPLGGGLDLSLSFESLELRAKGNALVADMELAFGTDVASVRIDAEWSDAETVEPTIVNAAQVTAQKAAGAVYWNKKFYVSNFDGAWEVNPDTGAVGIKAHTFGAEPVNALVSDGDSLYSVSPHGVFFRIDTTGDAPAPGALYGTGLPFNNTTNPVKGAAYHDGYWYLCGTTEIWRSATVNGAYVRWYQRAARSFRGLESRGNQLLLLDIDCICIVPTDAAPAGNLAVFVQMPAEAAPAVYQSITSKATGPIFVFRRVTASSSQCLIVSLPVNTAGGRFLYDLDGPSNGLHVLRDVADTAAAVAQQNPPDVAAQLVPLEDLNSRLTVTATAKSAAGAAASADGDSVTRRANAVATDSGYGLATWRGVYTVRAPSGGKTLYVYGFVARRGIPAWSTDGGVTWTTVTAATVLPTTDTVIWVVAADGTWTAWVTDVLDLSTKVQTLTLGVRVGDTADDYEHFAVLEIDLAQYVLPSDLNTIVTAPPKAPGAFVGQMAWIPEDEEEE